MCFLHHHLVFECHLRIRGVIESSRYRAKLELDSIKNLKLELDQAFFFSCLKLDSKNSRVTRTRLDKARIN